MEQKTKELLFDKTNVFSEKQKKNIEEIMENSNYSPKDLKTIKNSITTPDKKIDEVILKMKITNLYAVKILLETEISLLIKKDKGF